MRGVMKPPFAYYGGKQRIIKKILLYIPQHEVYAEPFAGSATMFFAKPDPPEKIKSRYIEAINDINSEVYNFFVILRDRPEELYHLIEHSLYSQEEHRKAKQYNGDDDLLRAYYFYINISQSYLNVLNKGWGTSLYINLVKHYKNKKEILPKCTERIKSCHIANEDALRFIERWDSPRTFFYCDPPYPNSDQGHYSGYTQEDFERLIDALDKAEGSFILSCFHNDAVPKEWQKVEIEAAYGASKFENGKRVKYKTECIWIRHAKNEVNQDRPQLIQPELAF